MKRKTYMQGAELYPLEFAGHHAQGAICGAIMPWHPIAALTLATLYIAYQGLSLVRKKDSAGLDVMDFGVGYGVGLLPALYFV